MPAISFSIEKKILGKLGRAGKITTPHGEILTPAFTAVGTKGSVKSLTPEHIRDAGSQAVLANTYHLHLEPGEELVAKAGGLGTFMNWSGPTFTDSGGFQVFSLGAAFGEGSSKFISQKEFDEKVNAVVVFDENLATSHGKLAQIDEDGVTFTSHLDGSLHRFTPERSIEIQHALGADIFFAFDECTIATAPYAYQREAMERTHRWAERSLKTHRQNIRASQKQAIFGVLQGGPYEDLRKESAKSIGAMEFDGFGIGGSYTKEQLPDVLRWVNAVLPEDKPRHLLGIGEPLDIFAGVELGCDTFDCVLPTRFGRTGTLFTENGRLPIKNAKYREDFSPIEKDCACYTCQNFTRAYIAHLLRSGEMLGATLATIHNLHFINHLFERIRQSIFDGTFFELKEKFYKSYKPNILT